MTDDDAVINETDYDSKTSSGLKRLKIICLGDSAVGKSKLVERFLMNDFKLYQYSTYALTLFRHEETIGNEKVQIDIWDTGGQERYNQMHPIYYHKASACILVFDATRKETYKNLKNWYQELRENRPNIPCLCAVNKIDEKANATKIDFMFPKKNKLPFYTVSAAKGTNVIRLFKDAFRAAHEYKNNPNTDIMDLIQEELDAMDAEQGAGDANGTQ